MPFVVGNGLLLSFKANVFLSIMEWCAILWFREEIMEGPILCCDLELMEHQESYSFQKCLTSLGFRNMSSKTKIGILGEKLDLRQEFIC